MGNRRIRNSKFKSLTAYLQNQPEVALAFLFGSKIKACKFEGPESDWDIGVYFWPKDQRIELEEPDYPARFDLWGKLEELLDEPVDLVVLNRVPATVAFTALTKGKPLVIKDKKLFYRLLSVVTENALSYREHIQNFWKIKQRSRSLTEEDRERLTRIADFLEDALTETERFRKMSWQDYSTNKTNQRDLERWVETIVNASIDIAETLLASAGKKIPSSYKKLLQAVGGLDQFDFQLGEDLSQWAKLRNLLAHEYLDLRWQDIQKFLKAAPSAYQRLVDKVNKMLDRNQGQ